MGKDLKSIAVLLTCYNRREKTLACLRSVYTSKELSNHSFAMEIYLTDDGSSDNTGKVVAQEYPGVHIISGHGNLYWTGGMRSSWLNALADGNYDGFLLLNDDTLLNDNCFNQLFETDDLSRRRYDASGIYIGSVIDPRTLKHTYGGSILRNKWTFEIEDIIPDGTIKECDFGNGNIMFVPRSVVDKIGILSNKYIHGKSDFDYTLRARKQGIPVLVCSDYCGYCARDHISPDFSDLTFRERLANLKSPKGVELHGYMHFMWSFFPLRAPFVFLSMWLKTLCPGCYKILNKSIRR